jgi:hypothetical protein
MFIDVLDKQAEKIQFLRHKITRFQINQHLLQSGLQAKTKLAGGFYSRAEKVLRSNRHNRFFGTLCLSAMGTRWPRTGRKKNRNKTFLARPALSGWRGP